jgi:signal transduction protein with GAF and PtsI domain
MVLTFACGTLFQQLLRYRINKLQAYRLIPIIAFGVVLGFATDVGGALSHGAVVAREYGLPAVVGVPGATTEIKNGDRIYLDGSSGVVVKLEEFREPA